MLALALAVAALPQEPSPSQAPALLVVAPHPLLAATQPLIELRRREGLRADAVALADALAGEGVGDADVMPVRFMVLDRCTPAAFDYAFYPSDLYYADLQKRDGSFEDWNTTKVGFHRGYYGEV